MMMISTEPTNTKNGHGPNNSFSTTASNVQHSNSRNDNDNDTNNNVGIHDQHNNDDDDHQSDNIHTLSLSTTKSVLGGSSKWMPNMDELTTETESDGTLTDEYMDGSDDDDASHGASYSSSLALDADDDDDDLLMTIPKKAVSFGTAEIRRYTVVLGDHPSPSEGFPLSLGWAFDPNTTVVDISTSPHDTESFSNEDLDHTVTTGGAGYARRLTVGERRRLLRTVGGLSESQMRRAESTRRTRAQNVCFFGLLSDLAEDDEGEDDDENDNDDIDGSIDDQEGQGVQQNRTPLFSRQRCFVFQETDDDDDDDDETETTGDAMYGSMDDHEEEVVRQKYSPALSRQRCFVFEDKDDDDDSDDDHDGFFGFDGSDVDSMDDSWNGMFDNKDEHGDGVDPFAGLD